MTPREHRLRRLADLREKQHSVAVVHLRTAQAELHAAKRAVLQAEQAVRDARCSALAAATDGNTGEWLAASAEAELYRFRSNQHRAAQTQAILAVNAAATQEEAARRERKQMEFTLDRVRREMAIESARGEQRRLDEAARLLKLSLRSNGHPSTL